MKTFMLVGDVSDNAGPSNVHRELIAHWPAEEGSWCLAGRMRSPSL